jgi:uncharacterized membrane protein
MSQDRTRKIVVTGVLGAISIFLGVTHWGFIPWFLGFSLTIMTVPVIIGAVLEGPWVGLGIGLIFGLFSMVQASVAPNGPGDVIFTNPLISILPRLFIGPVAWLTWNALKRWPVAGLMSAGVAGSLTNTVLVLLMIGLLGYASGIVLLGSTGWAALTIIFVINGLPEAALCGVITTLVVSLYWRIQLGTKKGADL